MSHWWDKPRADRVDPELIAFGQRVARPLVSEPTPHEPKFRLGRRRTGDHRPDGHGCCERIHPTELKIESGDRGEEW
jgi:hypothetical protein